MTINKMNKFYLRPFLLRTLSDLGTETLLNNLSELEETDAGLDLAELDIPSREDLLERKTRGVSVSRDPVVLTREAGVLGSDRVVFLAGVLTFRAVLLEDLVVMALTSGTILAVFRLSTSSRTHADRVNFRLRNDSMLLLTCACLRSLTCETLS